MIDPTGFDIGAFGAAAAALIKGLYSDRKTKAIEEDRVRSKQSIDTRFAVIEERQKNSDRRMNDSETNFKVLDAKLDRNNELLNQLLGEVRASRTGGQ